MSWTVASQEENNTGTTRHTVADEPAAFVALGARGAGAPDAVARTATEQGECLDAVAAQARGLGL